ncbi:MAG TPA: SLC13 family permease [Candidatus Limnocylindria bacterium]|nr:SLC13 family permease [Candidatus Limnocylindria bacterium]
MPTQRRQDELERLLRGVPFFRGLTALDAARLVGALEEARYPAGAVIAEEGAAGDALYLIAEGEVEISVRAPDGELSLRRVSAPAHFGELGMLLSRRTASSRAATDAVVWRLPRRRFEQLVRDRPEVGLTVAAALADELDRRSRELIGAPEPAPGARPMTIERETRSVSMRRRLISAAIVVAIPIILWNIGPPEGMSTVGWHIATLLLAGAVAWLLEPIPDFAVAMLLAATWTATGLVPLATAFGGFATSSWLLSLGALTLAAAMAQTGLVFRGALLMLRTVPPTHVGQVLALLVGGLILTPLVPQSVARVAAIAPLTNELAQSLGYPPRSRGSAAIAFAGLAGYWFFSSIFLTGLATNFFLVQLLPAAERARFSWLGWLGAAGPTGIVCLGGAAAAIFIFFRPERPPRGIAEIVARQQRVLGPLTRREGITLLAGIVLLAGLLQPFLQLDPAWWGVVALCIVMLGALDRERFRTSVDWGFLVLFGALLGSGEVARVGGLHQWLADRLVSATMLVHEPMVLVVLLALLTAASRIVLPSRPAMLLLMLATVPTAPALGISPWVAGITVLLMANGWVLPYQGLEYLVTRDATRGEAFSDRQGTMFGAALAITRFVAILVSLPYWRMLGLL